jgi:hypothetical protein
MSSLSSEEKPGKIRPVKITENNIFTVLSTANWMSLAVMAGLSLAFGSRAFAAGVLAGGLIAIANCYWLNFTLQRAMQLPPGKAVRFAQIRYILRLALIALAVSALIIYFKINILGLLLGLSVLVINIIGVTVYISTGKGG